MLKYYIKIKYRNQIEIPNHFSYVQYLLLGTGMMSIIYFKINNDKKTNISQNLSRKI